jgi:hypothetical protein
MLKEVGLQVTFGELKKLLFWTLDNGQNIDDLAFLGEDNDGKLINQGLRDLANCLCIIRYENSLTPDAAGQVNLPDDLRDVQLIKWGEYTKLTPITNVMHAAIGSKSVKQYMFTERSAIQLYDVPEPPYETIHLWYHAYPPELVNDDDVPTSVPAEFHEALATVYARAQFFKKLGDINQYQNLTGLWNMIKKQVKGIVEARTTPVRYDGRWEW